MSTTEYTSTTFQNPDQNYIANNGEIFVGIGGDLSTVGGVNDDMAISSTEIAIVDSLSSTFPTILVGKR